MPLALDIPGWGKLRLHDLVVDYNGTLACDGVLLPGVRRPLTMLARTLCLHVVTADTFGNAKRELRAIPCELIVLSQDAQDRAKAAYVRSLGAARTASIGNGRNDRLMLRETRLAIATIQGEGAAVESLREAHVVVTDIHDALQLLLHPKRLLATLRR